MYNLYEIDTGKLMNILIIYNLTNNYYVKRNWFKTIWDIR